MTSRRELLGGLGAWSVFVALHASLATARPASRRTSPLIRRLRLRTATPLAELAEFYGGSLGLPLERAGRSLDIRAGASTISFESSTAADAASRPPFYHVAFNVPQNKIRAARDWQRERTPLLAIPPRLQDPAYPDDVVHFRSWNAHSVFFLDPAGNVLEHIARHDLADDARGAFGPRDLRCASEIAFVTDDVPAFAGRLRRTFDLPPYRNVGEAFAAIGDEQGLLLVFRRGRDLGFGTNPPRRVDVHPAEVGIDGNESSSLEAGGLPYTIIRRPFP